MIPIITFFSFSIIPKAKEFPINISGSGFYSGSRVDYGSISRSGNYLKYQSTDLQFYTYDPMSVGLFLMPTDNSVFNDYDYLYFFGIGNQVVSATGCDPISLPPSYYDNVSNNGVAQQYVPYAFKCDISDKSRLDSSNNFYVHMNMIGYSSSKPFVSVYSYIYLLKKDDSAIESVEATIKEETDKIINSDISDNDKELPDDSSYNDYNGAEQNLLDKTKDIDLNTLDIGIDVNSSKWVWNTLTSFIQSHTVVFGIFISILSIGIIKLALGR